MLLFDVENYLGTSEDKPMLNQLFSFCEYFRTENQRLSQVKNQDFVFYAINEIFGNDIHTHLYKELKLYNKYADMEYRGEFQHDYEILTMQLSYIFRFLHENGLWEDIVYCAIMNYFDKKMKGSMRKKMDFMLSLQNNRNHWINLSKHLKLFFYDDSIWNIFCSYLNYNIHYYYLLYKLPMLRKYLMNKEDANIHINELKICLQITDRKDLLVETFVTAIAPKLLHIGNSTSYILTSCNLFLANLNDIDEWGELSRLICVPISEYLKTRKDLIKSIVGSLSSSSTFNEDFMRLNKDDPAKKSTLVNITSKIEPANSDDDGENLKGPLNALPTHESNTTDSSVIVSHTIYQTKRICRSTFDLLNSFIFVVGNARTFMSEFKKYLRDRILPFKSKEFLDEERSLLKFLMHCFGKELVFNCFTMLDDVTNSVDTTYKIRGTKRKMAIDAILTTPSVWPAMCVEEEINVPTSVNNFSKKYAKLFVSTHANRSLEWFPEYDLLEVDVVIGKVTKTFVCSPNQGKILVLFNNNVILSHEDIMKTSTIADMGTIKKVVLYWLQIDVIVNVTEDSFQLAQSFT